MKKYCLLNWYHIISIHRLECGLFFSDRIDAKKPYRLLEVHTIQESWIGLFSWFWFGWAGLPRGGDYEPNSRFVHAIPGVAQFPPFSAKVVLRYSPTLTYGHTHVENEEREFSHSCEITVRPGHRRPPQQHEQEDGPHQASPRSPAEILKKRFQTR